MSFEIPMSGGKIVQAGGKERDTEGLHFKIDDCAAVVVVQL